MCRRILMMMAIIAMSGLAMANTADITQDGPGNDATITQAGTNNAGTINQYGTNLADIQQTGDDNTAQIDQGASGSPVSNNHLPAYAGDWWLAAYIEQTGSVNYATTAQRRSSTYSHIKQTGDDNTATQDIDTSQSKANSTYSPRRGVQIDQVGNGNEAHQTTLASFGCFGIQNMQILQTGNDNYAQQDSIGGMSCVMEIFQEGDGNSSTQYQDARFSVAHVDILGDNNTTSQTQQYTSWGDSCDSDALIDIIGDGNTANQSQTGEFHFADIDVLGDGNFASQTQTGDSQSSTISQTGNGNTANVVQGP